MSDERAKTLHAATSWLRATFWDEVECEVEALDWYDFVEFLEADELPIPIRPEFREELRGRLREFVRTRYSQ
jgi:hypothetical protein